MATNVYIATQNQIMTGIPFREKAKRLRELTSVTLQRANTIAIKRRCNGVGVSALHAHARRDSIPAGKRVGREAHAVHRGRNVFRATVVD